MRTIWISLFSLVVCSTWAQPFSEETMALGYEAKEDKVLFIFNPSLYGVQPERVQVTGSFRGWDQNMEASEWTLNQTGALWLLEIDNTNFQMLGPGAEFKFRIDNGQWLDPPTQAPNEKGGNLVFMHDVEIPELRAEIVDAHTIWATVSGPRPLQPSAYQLSDAQGKPIAISAVLPNTET
ncbi:MAG: pullulanase, partial [Bacteroidota bacterium]